MCRARIRNKELKNMKKQDLIKMIEEKDKGGDKE